ncbi:DUF3298 and DUF4163 domain-containing protein [Aquimarina sp. ERC-38]|uniref:DUF3298 and DUF4163 domain-containing protein n=1 Tax=Aquimarina sp. ERC-38 TaxID=2949996 RepID=UPI0022482849|nr:DUF3298 and DUF4163 domain-containing protein [Aquimarina sp. ERC-38]UZO82045.1 DUF3298 and DUF4163 domain-containing protein [Aquimarina sp. ERC-38]
MINKIKNFFIIVVLSTLGLLIGSCSKKEDFHTEKLLLELPDTDCTVLPCATLDISIIRIFGLENSEKINSKIEKHIINILDTDQKGAHQTVEEAMLAFNDMYVTMKSQFSEELFTYEATVDCNVHYQSVDLLTVEMDHYLFTGGAHGYEGVSFIHFNPQTGQELSINELFKNPKKIAQLCEKAFRVQNHISSEKSINSTGFNFENDQFYLPENIAFEKDSLLLYYNTYEINPYVSSNTLLKVPLSQLKDQLKVDIIE